MVFLKILGVVVLLFLASCWSPVFNQDLSVAALVRDKLHLDESFSATLNSGGNNDNQYQAVFSYDSQLLTVVGSNRNQVNESGYFSGSNQNFNQSLDVSLADPAQVVVIPFSVNVAAFIPTMANGSSGRGAVVRIDKGIPPALTTIPFPTTTTFSASAPGDILGFYGDETPASVLESFYLTSSATGTSLWREATSPVGTPTPTSVWLNAPYTGTAGWMAVNLTGPTVYLSHPADKSGSYLTDVINSTGLITSWKGNDHVVAFLSTGRLLTREGSFYNVCDTTGKILYSFPAGTLKFAGDYIDIASGQYRTHFSEALLITPQNGGQDTVRVKAYSIETAKLEKLQ